MPENIAIRQDKSDKVVRFKAPRGGLMSLVREVYFKSDLPCRTTLCNFPHCHAESDVQKLSSDTQVVCILDGSVALNFWELFEFPNIQGVIVTLTTLNYVQHVGGKRFYYRIKRSLKDPGLSCVLFDNEYHEDCFVPQLPLESTENYATRMNYATARWYRGHLKSHVQLLFVSENPRVEQVALEWDQGDKDEHSVQCLNVAQLLKMDHYSSLSAAHTLYQSLQASLQTQTTSASNMKDGSIGTEDGYHPRELLVSGLSSGSLLRGSLQVGRFNSTQEATVSVSDKQLKETEQRSEVLILGAAARNRAIHGDIVVIELVPRTDWKSKSQRIFEEGEPAVGNEQAGEVSTSRVMPTGRVVGIWSRNWRDYVCCVENQNSGTDESGKVGGSAVIVTPFDRRIPRIRIYSSDATQLHNKRFIVRIDDWDLNSLYPRGHFVQSLGQIGDLDVETHTLLIEHGLTSRAFTAAQLRELPENSAERPWRVSPDEVRRRRDLRQSHLIFSIDPLGCQDVDDTLSIRHLEGGKVIELGVHIADVSHFVAANSLLDLEARVRSTSVYMADRRIDMLPHVLSGDLCSLWSNVDRYAVSVMWTLNASDLSVLDVWYGRTVIRSRYKLHYELAQDIYEGKYSAADLLLKVPELKKAVEGGAALDPLVKELRTAIKQLVSLASEIQSRRLMGGGLELEGLEVQVVFSDPDRKNMEDLLPKQPLQMHETIAECMIFANHYVAKRILRSFRHQSCLRRHPPPRQDYFDHLKLCAGAINFDIATDSNKTLAESLAKAEVAGDPQVNRILRTMATQAMSNAVYFSTGSIAREEFAHYGLALDLYTHFTSPIRRYADILVHRLLLAALEMDVEGVGSQEEEVRHPQLLSNSALEEQCRQMNEQHRRAQHVQRASVEMFQAIFFKSATNPAVGLAEAVVYSIRENGLIVLVPRYGIKCAVSLKRRDGSVAWAQEPGGSVEWLPSTVGASLQRPKNGVSLLVRNPEVDSIQEYRVFDHVRVRLSASDNMAHGVQVKAEFQGRVARKSPIQHEAGTEREGSTATVSRHDVVKSVQEAAKNKASGKKRAADFGDDVEEGEVLDGASSSLAKQMRRIHNSSGQYLFWRQMCASFQTL